MKMLRFTIRYFTLIALALTPHLLHSQSPIQITSQTFINYIGSRQVVLEDARFSFPIDLGSPGENQIWDFRSQAIEDSIWAIFEFLSPTQIPNLTRFPEANVIEKVSSPDALGSAFYEFYNITPSLFITLGDSAEFVGGGFDTTIISFQNDTISHLPISYNDTWFTFERDTDGFYPIQASISIDTTLNFVDGWGTVRLPLGDFECLRIREEVKTINQTVVNGAIISSGTDTFISYIWVGPDGINLANAQSQFGNTNPNFTDATGFGRIDSLRTGSPSSVGDTGQIPTAFQLHQNYPNPFNPETVIKYELRQNTRVELSIFNLLGQQIRKLVSANQSAGSYELVWNGTDDAGSSVSSGVYLYELRADDARHSKKMLLLQ